jgi:hypothetical protein
MSWLGLEPGTPLGEASEYLPDLWHGPLIS